MSEYQYYEFLVWEILHAASIEPALRRAGPTWREFLTAQAHAIIACGFLVVETVLLKRLPALVFTGHGTRRLHLAGRRAREYRNPVPFAGLDVLVAGAGNSGSEIAADLVEGGARRVWIAVRTPPQIVRRDVAGWPAHVTGILVSRLPAPLVDPVARLQRRLTIPDLTP